MGKKSNFRIKILYRPSTIRLNKINEKVIDLSIHEVYTTENASNIDRPGVDKKLIKDLYLNKIHESLQFFFDNSKDIEEVISYQTFSKLSVVDFLIDRFWVINEYIKLLESYSSLTYVIIDDKLCYNVLKNRNDYNILPIKPFYYLLAFLRKKSIFREKYIQRIYKPTFLFFGHKYDSSNQIDNYSDYFFKTSWQNLSENTHLLLRKNNASEKLKSKQISFVEDRIPIRVIIYTFIIAFKNFYFPLKVPQRDIYDLLINQNLRTDASNGSFFENHIWASIMREGFKISEWDKIQQIIIPFEGRAYEKQIIYYLHSINFKGNIIGYAHFPLSEKIINYFKGPFENTYCKKLKIITIGRNNREMIYKSGWCENQIQNEFYLKRIDIPRSHISPHLRASKGLVLLGNGIVQSKKILSTLTQSGITKYYKLNIRCHPALDLKSILEFVNGNETKLCEEKSLSNAISKADFIIYGDTGAAIDALPFNKPMYYIKDDNILCSDRILDNQKLHRRFDSFEELKSFVLSKQIKKDIEDSTTISREESISNYFSSNSVSWI